MSAPTKKAPKKAPAKRSPRAAKPTERDLPEVTDEKLAALAEEQPEPEPGEIRPVVIGKRGRRGEAPVEMVTIFVVDDVPYQIPRNPSAALVLSWMLDLQKVGLKQANTNMGLELLGEEPFQALKSSPDTEPEDLYDIFANIGVVFFTSENYRRITAAPDPS